MSTTPLIDQIAERAERLLQRHAELQQQLHAVSAERDSLKSRLQAARARIDTLIDRLQPAAEADADVKTEAADTSRETTP